MGARSSKKASKTVAEAPPVWTNMDKRDYVVHWYIRQIQEEYQIIIKQLQR